MKTIYFTLEDISLEMDLWKRMRFGVTKRVGLNVSTGSASQPFL